MPKKLSLGSSQINDSVGINGKMVSLMPPRNYSVKIFEENISLRRSQILLIGSTLVLTKA